MALSLLFALAIANQPAPPIRAAHDITSYLPGREEDARVAGIAWRLATDARARCSQLEPASGLVLQHLSQFQLADRVGIVTRLPLAQGPGVTAVVPGSPAAVVGIHAGDVLLAINDTALPSEPDLDRQFDAVRAHTRADAIADLLQTARRVTLLRDGETFDRDLAPVPACASRVHLARSTQRNAFADGRHVFLTTGMLARLRNDDELAFLIAHEMAHNLLGHPAQMREGSLGRRGVRALERAADLFGAEMMLDAGYDPIAGAALLARIGGSNLGITLFAQHEPVATRLAAIRALVKQHTQP